jgi:phosphoadenosine phosphosulfate reductase
MRARCVVTPITLSMHMHDPPTNQGERITRIAAVAGTPPHDARVIMERTLGIFRGRVAVSVSFGGGGIVLAHMVAQIDRTTPILFLDTGFHFPETLALRDRFAAQYGLSVRLLRPAYDPGPLYTTDPDKCCAIRKVQPMRHALRDYDAWISALRRDQSQSRAQVAHAELDATDGRLVTRIHPLAAWTGTDVRRYIADHELPYHPLLDRGFSSIGCWPCTTPTAAGEHERAGRWRGTGKTECGLHAFTDRAPR